MKEHRLSNNHPMLSMILALLLSTILDISLAIAGLYMIRPAVRDDIDAIWEKKWSIS